MPEQLTLMRTPLRDTTADVTPCMPTAPPSEAAEVERWRTLMQTAREYAQSLADLDALIFADADFSLPMHRWIFRVWISSRRPPR